MICLSIKLLLNSIQPIVFHTIVLANLFQKLHLRVGLNKKEGIFPQLLFTSPSDIFPISENIFTEPNALATDINPENVHGIDISKTMIDHAKKNTIGGLKYSVIGDKGDFPYESDFFDRIYSYAVFQHISESKK